MVSIIATVCLTATLFGVAAVWAASGRAGLFWRWLPLTVLLSALAPIGAYELVAMFGVQAATVIAGLWLARVARDRSAKTTTSAKPARPSAQFSLADLFQGVLLAGILLAMLRAGAPGNAAMNGTPIEWFPWVMRGFICGLLTLAGYGIVRWLALGPLRRVPGELVRIIAATGLCMAFLYLGTVYQILLPPRLPSARSGVANSHVDILRIIKGVNWAASPFQDYDLASDELIAALTATHETLRRPGFSQIEYTNAYLINHLSNIQNFRALCWALDGKAKSGLANGRPGDALEDYLDMIRLSVVISNGGLMVDDLVADAIAKEGLNGIGTLLPRLDVAQLAMLSQELKKLEESRQPWQESVDRDMAFGKTIFGWYMRLRYEELNSMNQAAYVAGAEARLRTDALMRLTLAEIAIRRHRQHSGAWPTDLASLVPEYASAAPTDPYRTGPLVYRLTEDGYLLYSVGEDRSDDGGKPLSYDDQLKGFTGDLFFDSIWVIPPGPVDADDDEDADEL